MALDPDAVFGALLAAAANSTDPAGVAAWAAIAAVINAQLAKADVSPTGTVPMNVVVGAPGATPVVGTGKIV